MVQSISQPQVKVEESGNEAMAAHQGGGGDFDWGNSKGREGVCFWCGKPGHVTAKCIADMPPNIKNKILGGSISANVAKPDDYTFLTDNIENIALSSFVDSGSARSEGVSSGRKTHVGSKRGKVEHSQDEPEYVL